MQRSSDSRAASRATPRTAPRRAWGLAVLVLVAAALAWLALAGRSPAPAADAATGTLPLSALVVGGWLLLLTGAVAAWAAGSVIARWRMAERVREARADAQALSQLLDVWQWRSDRDHRLVRLQPPQDAPASSWAGGATPSQVAQYVWDRFDAGDALRERLDAQAAFVDVPATRRHGDATEQWLLRGVPRFDAAGEFAGYSGTARRLESASPGEPSTAPAATEAAADAAAFSYTVSHDLRAPLRVVEGFARILKEDYGAALDRVGNDHLDRVLAAAARMNQMIDALLALSRLSTQPLARQPVNLSQLAQFVVDDLRRAQPERRVEVNIEPGLQAHGDPTLLRMVLENLLGNAWKYSARAETARISLERHRHAGRDAFVVRDNGAGFDMRFAERLFGVFQRLHSANDFPGTGVGLASVKRIVQRHGGDVWAESEVGKGASFWFTLGG